MAIEFPNWIKPSTSQGYSFSQDGSNMNYSETSGGLSRASLKYDQNKVQFPCSFVINNGVEMQGWNDWYYNVSNQGTSKFIMSLDVGDGLLDHTCIIVPGSYSVTGDFPWVITCTIEAEEPVTQGYDGSLFDLLQAGYTDIEPLLDRLYTFANDDLLLFKEL